MKIHTTVRTPILLALLLACLLPSFAAANQPSVKERINQFVGREVFVDVSAIDAKIHTWKDIQKWVPPRGKNSPLRMAYPESLKGSGISEVITVRLIITPEGQVLNPMIEDLKNKELAVPAILHAANLKFEIPRINGQPVYLEQKVKLVCSEDPSFGKKK